MWWREKKQPLSAVTSAEWQNPLQCKHEGDVVKRLPVSSSAPQPHNQQHPEWCLWLVSTSIRWQSLRDSFLRDKNTSLALKSRKMICSSCCLITIDKISESAMILEINICLLFPLSQLQNSLKLLTQVFSAVLLQQLDSCVNLWALTHQADGQQSVNANVGAVGESLWP